MKTYTASRAIRDEQRRRDDLVRIQRLNPGLEVTDETPHVTVEPVLTDVPVGRGARRQRRAMQRALASRAADSIRRGLRDAR